MTAATVPTGSDGDATAPVPGWARLLRVALLALAAVEIVGVAIELATLRHWKEGTQVIPWVTLGVLAAALVLAAWRPFPGSDRVVRILAVVVAVSALFGIYEHVQGNYDVAPLDYRYAPRWDGMSELSRWWAAATESVGPSPVLAPAVLFQVAIVIVLATLIPSARPAADATQR